MSNFLVCIMLRAANPEFASAKIEAAMVTVAAAFILDIVRLVYWREK